MKILNKLQSKRAFSFTEIVVASVIFVLVSAGVLVAMSNLRAPAEGSKTKLQAMYVGRQVTEELKNAVSAVIEEGFTAPGTYNIPQLDPPFQNITGTYTIVEDTNNYRTVTFNIQFPDNVNE